MPQRPPQLVVFLNTIPFHQLPAVFHGYINGRINGRLLPLTTFNHSTLRAFYKALEVLCNCQKQMIFFKERALQMPLNYFIYKHGSTGDVSIDTEDFQLFLIWWLLAHIVFLIKELACQTGWSWFSTLLPVIKSLSSKGAFYFHRYKYVLKPNIGAYKAELVVKLESYVQVNTALRPKSFLSVAVAVVTVEGSLKCTVAASFDGRHVRTEVTYFTHPPTSSFLQKSKASTFMNKNVFWNFCFFPRGQAHLAQRGQRNIYLQICIQVSTAKWNPVGTWRNQVVNIKEYLLLYFYCSMFY